MSESARSAMTRYLDPFDAGWFWAWEISYLDTQRRSVTSAFRSFRGSLRQIAGAQRPAAFTFASRFKGNRELSVNVARLSELVGAWPPCGLFLGTFSYSLVRQFEDVRAATPLPIDPDKKYSLAHQARSSNLSTPTRDRARQAFRASDLVSRSKAQMDRPLWPTCFSTPRPNSLISRKPSAESSPPNAGVVLVKGLGFERIVAINGDVVRDALVLALTSTIGEPTDHCADKRVMWPVRSWPVAPENQATFSESLGEAPASHRLRLLSPPGALQCALRGPSVSLRRRSDSRCQRTTLPERLRKDLGRRGLHSVLAGIRLCLSGA
jgi:hypothetical protein